MDFDILSCADVKTKDYERAWTRLKACRRVVDRSEVLLSEEAQTHLRASDI